MFIAVTCGGCGFLLMQAMDSSGVNAGIETARSHPAVIEAIGEPVDASWLPRNLQFNTRNNEMFASSTVELSGPNGSGTLEVEAVSRGGEWTLERLEFRPAGGDWIDLLEPGSAAPAPLDDQADRRARFATASG